MSKNIKALILELEGEILAAQTRLETMRHILADMLRLEGQAQTAPKDKVQTAPKDKVQTAPKDKVQTAPKDKVQTAPKVAATGGQRGRPPMTEIRAKTIAENPSWDLEAIVEWLIGSLEAYGVTPALDVGQIANTLEMGGDFPEWVKETADKYPHAVNLEKIKEVAKERKIAYILAWAIVIGDDELESFAVFH